MGYNLSTPVRYYPSQVNLHKTLLKRQMLHTSILGTHPSAVLLTMSVKLIKATALVHRAMKASCKCLILNRI